MLKNSITWFSKTLFPHLLSLSPTLVSKTTLPPRLHMYTKPILTLSKQSTTLCLSQVLKLNYSLWDVVSTKYAIKITSQRLLLSLILYTQQNTSLTACRTHFSCTQLLFLVNYNFSSIKVRTIPLNFGSVLVALSGGFTKMLTRIPSCSNLLPYFLAKLRGIFARKPIATISSNNGKCVSKHLTVKEITFWTY